MVTVDQLWRNQAEVVRRLRRGPVQVLPGLRLAPGPGPLAPTLAPARAPDLIRVPCLLLLYLAAPVLVAEAPLPREKGPSLMSISISQVCTLYGYLNSDLIYLSSDLI